MRAALRQQVAVQAVPAAVAGPVPAVAVMEACAHPVAPPAAPVPRAVAEQLAGLAPVPDEALVAPAALPVPPVVALALARAGAGVALRVRHGVACGRGREAGLRAAEDPAVRAVVVRIAAARGIGLARPVAAAHVSR